ncbi:unnamed protein product [Absidia cylindrospora]
MVYFAIAPFSSSFGGKQLVIDGNVLRTEFIPVENKTDTNTKPEDVTKQTAQSTFCHALSVSLGTFTRPTIYQEMWKTNRLVRLGIDTMYQTLEIGFLHDGFTYKMDFPWSNLAKEVTMEATTQAITTFALSLRYPPRLWRKDLDHELGHTVWVRSTELFMDTPPPTSPEPSPLTLDIPENQVDLGAWTDYRLEFNAKEVASHQFEFVVKQLMNHDLLRHTLIYQRSTAISVVSGRKQQSFYNHSDRANATDYDILYMLECAITKRYLNQYTLDAAFYDRLNQLGVSIACRILSWIISENTAKYNAYSAFQTAWQRIKSTLRISSATMPDDCCLISSALVTPTSFILLPPTMEQTNRTLRQFSTYSDRFLRVSFVEDDLTLLTQTPPRDFNQTTVHKQDALYNRLYKVMIGGIKIGNRRYDFLAYDSTQLSSHSCWFFAATSTLSASDIRTSLWDTDSLTNLSEYIGAADICFQPTRPLAIFEPTKPDDTPMESSQQKTQKQAKKKSGRRQRPSQQERKQQQQQPKEEDKTVEWIDDLYTLSDKVRHVCGKVSPKTVRDVTQALQLENTPSAIQYSLGGCLGVLALSNFINGKTKIQIRPCHYIFDKKPLDLQIAHSSSYAPAFLDRTLMTLLSGLGVSGHLFLTMVQHSMAMMNSAFNDATTATEYLKTFASNERNGIQTMRNMIGAGFLSRRDPYLLNMLWVFRTRRLIEMKKKAALHVSKGAHLMVIMDETNTLAPDEVFCQISDLKSGQLSKRTQVKGACFVVKQPCIHSGNIRIFEAVDHPALRHWCDVIVISSRYRDDAPRQHLDGKMDGQRFTIIWDPSMQPYSKLAKTLNNREPSDEAIVPAKTRMTPSAAIQSFVNYIRNDYKDTLIRFYLMTTEKAGYNTQDSSCIKLALQYADASDYTNIPCSISIDHTLESTVYPDYMEVPNIPTHQSSDIQGQIYRMISPALYQNYTEQMILKNSHFVVYDPRLKIAGMEPYVIEARDLKTRYDYDIKSLMQQYGINTEVELVTGNVVDDSRQHYGDQGCRTIQRERMLQAVEALQRHYLHLFHQEFEPVVVDDPTRPPLDLPPIRRDVKDTVRQKEIKAAAWYYITYHPTERPKSTSAIMLSFPWILSDILSSVARRQHNAIDDSALEKAAIEQYRKQSDDVALVSVDGDEGEDDESEDDDDDDDDDDEDDSDESDDDESNNSVDDDSDSETGFKDNGNTGSTAENQPCQFQQGSQDDGQASVPVFNIKLSDIVGL